jgi:hypothetical protein
MDRRKFIQRASSSAALFSASRLLGQRGGPGLIEPIGIPPKRRPPLRFYDYQLCYVRATARAFQWATVAARRFRRCSALTR